MRVGGKKLPENNKIDTLVFESLEYWLKSQYAERRSITTTLCFWSIEIPKKVFGSFDNVFYVYLMSGLQKNAKKKFLWCFFFKSTLSVLRCTWTGRINLKIFLGHHIKYLSIWPFMCHPWFPTKKASKLTFACFQLAGKLTFVCWHHPASWKQSHGHHPHSIPLTT